jgi:hypothetical protein
MDDEFATIFKGDGNCPNEVLSVIYLEGMKKTLSEDSQCPDPTSKGTPQEYKSTVGSPYVSFSPGQSQFYNLCYIDPINVVGTQIYIFFLIFKRS